MKLSREIEINKKVAVFNFKQIWFADHPFDVDGTSRVIFKDCKNSYLFGACQLLFKAFPVYF